MCVWSATVAGALLTFFPCGRILGSGGLTFKGDTIEHVNLQVALNKSSTCRHARAQQLAYDELASEYEAYNIDELLDLFLDLAGAEESKQVAVDNDTAVDLALHSGKKEDVPIFAIFFEGVWSPTIARRRSNKHHLATCFLLSCSSHSWCCIHSQAVNEYNKLEAAAASTAAAEFNEALQFGPSGVLNDDGDEQQPSSLFPPRMDAAATPLPSRLRRARSMFPCASDFRQCDRYPVVIDTCRTPGEAKIL